MGAEDGARTRDLNLGKVALYQLSYFRIAPEDNYASRTLAKCPGWGWSRILSWGEPGV